ncbi:hypothetical protein MSG28_004720 [Choristoneura fumiferana]|uniref:Uncharacterized protein n=1 Tax=Choristoneura fumiferana TaxID=7141 RepID=A0ACC0K7D7_CHOFU|nr:hypothetical protein MSG28_004720 [Choristoneura fumiferana]
MAPRQVHAARSLERYWSGIQPWPTACSECCVIPVALQVYGWVLWACALLCVCVACALYACNVRSALRHWGGAATHVAFVLAVYPVVSIAAFMALVVPRTQVLSEAISQEAVMLGLYHFYCLVVAECGGPEHLVRRTEGSLLETRVLPCCFYPCCILPRPKLQPRHFKVLRMLLLQVPVIQGLIYIAILGLRAEDVSVYLSNYIYFQPLVAASVLTGIWGIMMCLKAAEATGARPRARFLALQFALIIVKVQCGVAKTLPTLTSLKCLFALNPSVVVDYYTRPKRELKQTGTLPTPTRVMLGYVNHTQKQKTEK